jgi:hypothetical protein
MARSQEHYVPHAQPEYETEPPAWTNDVDPEIFGMYELSMDQHLEILQRRPQHRAQILKYLQETFGNQHVHELVQRLDAPVATPTPAAAETAAAEAAYQPMGDDLMTPDFDAAPAGAHGGNDTDLMNPYADDPAPIVREAEVQRDPEQTVRAVEELPPVTRPEPETVHIEMEPEVIEVARAEGKKGEKEKPAWVVGAERYNFAHPKYVDEFYENTQWACHDEETGEPDVYAVAQWQAEAGLQPDGRIGPDTVDCSRIEILEEPAVAPEPLPDNVA